MGLRNFTYFCISAISIIAALVYGKDLILPFILGLLFWFMMHGLKGTLNRVPFIKKKFPNWLTSLLAIIIFLGWMGLFAEILMVNIVHLTQSYAEYQPNVDSIINSINEFFNINLTEMVGSRMGEFDFGNLLGSIFSSISDILGNAFMIVLYALFIIIEEHQFEAKIQQLFPDKNRFDKFWETMNKIQTSISDYFRLKAMVSLITGVLSFIALWLIGIDSPAFWGFLIFILNFIPTIGSLVATIFPAIYALLQFGTFLPPILILSIVGIVQLIVGNYIEPRVMGSSMNISPLVTILALTFWGMLWGVTGMILSIPIMVVIIIIFSQFESTRPAAILLSEKGEIEAMNK